MGILQYFAKYFAKFAEQTRFIRQKIKNPTEYSDKEKAEILRLTKQLQNPHVITTASPELDTQIYCDASSIALGYVAFQNGKMIDIANVANEWNQTQRGNPQEAIIDLELKAILLAVSKLRYWIDTTKTIIFSDSLALVTILNKDMRQFQLTVKHIKGKDNCIADALSRSRAITHIAKTKEMAKNLYKHNSQENASITGTTETNPGPGNNNNRKKIPWIPKENRYQDKQSHMTQRVVMQKTPACTHVRSDSKQVTQYVEAHLQYISQLMREDTDKGIEYIKDFRPYDDIEEYNFPAYIISR